MSENEIVERLIKEDSEHELLEFKFQVYPMTNHRKKHEFIKDICAFANSLSNEIKYIIIGVKKENGEVKYNSISKDIDHATYSQFIHSAIEPKINFDYKTITIDGNVISYFKIYNNIERPYLLKKEIRNFEFSNRIEFKEGEGFIRKSTVNHKLTRNDFEDIYKEKYHGPDIRNLIDATVTRHSHFFKSDYINEYYTYLDVFIENGSNKSIFIDVTIRISKSDDYLITELPKYIDRKKKEMTFRIWDEDAEKQEFFDFRETPKFYIAEAKAKPYAQGAFYLRKGNTVFPSFGRHLVLEMKKSSVTIIGHIEINSDSFHEGNIIKHFSM